MRFRFFAAAGAALALVAMTVSPAGAQDVSSATAVIAGTPLDGARSIDTVGFATVTLTGARTGMTGGLGVRVVEASRTGTTPIRVKVSAGDLLCGAVTAQRKNLSVLDRAGSVSYIPTQAGPLGSSTAISGESALGDATTNAATPADVFLIEGEDPQYAYTTNVTPHVATGTLKFVVPADVPAQACAGTLTYDMVYA